MKFEAIEINPILEDLIPDFVRNTIKDIEELESSYKELNWDLMSTVCHRAIGPILSYGFTQLDSFFSETHNSIRLKDEKALRKNMENLSQYKQFLKEEFLS